MEVTQIEALFSEEDLREFLIRLVATFPGLNIESNFFESGYLFHVSEGSHTEYFYPADLPVFLGLFTSDYPENDFNRKVWLANFLKTRQNMGLTAGILHLRNPLDPYTQSYPDWDDEEEEAMEKNRFKEPVGLLQPDEKQLSRAEAFVAQVWKDIPKEGFEKFVNEHQSEVAEMVSKVKRAKEKLPVSFNWNALSEEKRTAFTRHILGEDYHPEMSKEELEEDWNMLEDLAHLVWAKKNGLVKDLIYMILDPRWDVDLNKYEGLGHDIGGISLDAVWKYYRLEEVIHLFPYESFEPME